MKRRVFVGGLHHESDTFNPITTSWSDIWIKRGDEIINKLEDDSISGIVSTLLDNGIEVVPSLEARAVPNGEWDKDCYESLKMEMLDTLVREADSLDGICLSLHGSMRVRGIGEAEGDLLEAIRSICPNIPIVSSLDMHATITKRMLANADAFIGYKCAPHTDTFLTGELAARTLLWTLESGKRPYMAAVHLPFLVAGEQSETSVEPMKSLTQDLREREKDGVLALSLLLGFPWADCEENGVTAIAVAETQEKADMEALRSARDFWSRRHEFHFYNETCESYDALVATKDSLDNGIWPVVISDSGDNPTAGSSQDVTNFLLMILEDRVLSSLTPPLCYQGFYDPELCKMAFDAGVGNTVIGTIGAAFDKKTSSPINVRATVKSLKKAWNGARGADLALLDIGGVDVVVTSGHVGCYDPEMMRVLGVVPEERLVIVVKLGYLEPEIRAIARRSILALTDGSTNEVFSRLEYKNLKRPIFPLDDIDIEPTLMEY